MLAQFLPHMLIFLSLCKRFGAHAHVSHFPSKTQGREGWHEAFPQHRVKRGAESVSNKAQHVELVTFLTVAPLAFRAALHTLYIQ